MKKYLLLASLVLSGLCALSCDDDKDEKKGGDSKENVCENEGETSFSCVDGKSVTKSCIKIDGILDWGESSENCLNGCDDATGKCKAKADVECTKENEVAACGSTRMCVEGKCEDIPKPDCVEDADCGEKICEEGKCVAVQCTETVCDSDNKTLKICDKGRITTDECSVTCRDNACRDADYCTAAYTEPCLSRTDGRTMCNTRTNTCDTFACTEANCGAGTTCVLGVCLPDNQDNTHGSQCDPDKFISFCDEDGKLTECYFADKTDSGEKIYKIRHRACTGGNQCRSYKSGIGVATDCVIMSDMCAGSPTKSVCDEKYDYYEYAQYTCTRSTNNETISVLSDVDYCDDPYCISCGVW